MANFYAYHFWSQYILAAVVFVLILLIMGRRRGD